MYATSKSDEKPKKIQVEKKGKFITLPETNIAFENRPPQ